MHTRSDMQENGDELKQAVQDLFDFAIDREDVKWLLSLLPQHADIRPYRVEYELQILKIISVGWSLSYHLERSPLKEDLSVGFWKAVHEFCGQLSETTGLMIGNDINYFRTLKDRLDMYVSALGASPETSEPVSVIGPLFAGACGNGGDVFILMTGSKMFMNAFSRVRQYLEAVHLK
jgi:hypothetical protein